MSPRSSQRQVDDGLLRGSWRPGDGKQHCPCVWTCRTQGTLFRCPWLHSHPLALAKSQQPDCLSVSFTSCTLAKLWKLLKYDIKEQASHPRV